MTSARPNCMRRVLSFALISSVAVLLGALRLPATPAAGAEPPAAGSKYIGAAKCATCHESDAVGNQDAKWKASKHAAAFATLATDEAKELAKAKGIEDPQKADACLKCHVTAFGVPAEEIAKGFDPALGVQCESCHGPGEAHMKARVAAVAKAGGGKPAPVAAGEINSVVGADTCTKCHNKESPSFKGFCFPARHAQIVHLNPGKERTPEEVKKLTEGCTTPDCKDCAGGG